MQVATDVLDVFPDGTITKLILKTDPMSVTICRKYPDQNFTVEKIDVVERERMKEALDALTDHLRDYCICSIDINGVDGRKITLNI